MKHLHIHGKTIRGKTDKEKKNGIKGTWVIELTLLFKNLFPILNEMFPHLIRWGEIDIAIGMEDTKKLKTVLEQRLGDLIADKKVVTYSDIDVWKILDRPIQLDLQYHRDGLIFRMNHAVEACEQGLNEGTGAYLSLTENPIW